MSAKPAQEVLQLREQIRRHNKLYYIDAEPEISDIEYDKILRRLQDLEAAHPELVTADSPTQRIGDELSGDLPQVAHKVPMLSIDNTYSAHELREFCARVVKLLAGEPVEWVVELKVDGVAASIIYRDGLLAQAITRGNGQVGDDVTHNMRTVVDVPLKLLGDNPPPVLEVRGEVYMTNSELVRLNKVQQAQDLPTYKNTRNLSAGSIKVLDPKICAARNLRFFAHSVGDYQGLPVKSHMEFLHTIAEYGIPPTPQVKVFADYEAAIAHCDEIIEHLHELDFEVDGLVLKVNRFDQRERAGYTSKSPRWVAAYKFEKYEAITTVQRIDVQVGKTGAITPVAILKPVELAGTTVSRASLHNAEEIERKDVREGDTVVVEKAGKIIPHIVRVEIQERQGDPPKFPFPTHCPVCDTPVVKDDGGVYIRCPNPQCPAQLKERIRYFATRNAMDIEGLGDKLVEQLVDSKLVTGYADVYRLKDRRAELLELERTGEKTVENLLKHIEASKERGLAKLLNALSIRHVGNRTSTILAEHFGDIDAMLAATEEQLSQIHEVGDVIAESIFQFLREQRPLIEELRGLGLKMTHPKNAAAATDGKLSGKTLVVTGTLVKYKRDEIEALIAQHGGKPGSSVSKKTSYLVAGAEAGSKLEKAQSLGVPVITEEEFEKLIADQP